jgi:hypothetical protein
MTKADSMYQPSPELTPKQCDFLGCAWAFLQSRPEKAELDKLLIFAELLLPEEDAECLRRAVENGQIYPPGDPNNDMVN